MQNEITTLCRLCQNDPIPQSDGVSMVTVCSGKICTRMYLYNGKALYDAKRWLPTMMEIFVLYR